MKLDLTNAIYHDEDAARAHLESIRWPEGPRCARCGSEHVTRMKGKSHRPGLFHCNLCEMPFSVTINTVMERSKIPLAKWVLGFQLMASSKKGVSSHQLHRMLGITYKSAWFLSMRIREAMGLPKEPPKGSMGGKGKSVEADETYVGGKARNAKKGKPIPPKHAVVTLVERGGKVHAEHVPNVSAKNVRAVMNAQLDKASDLKTDSSLIYDHIGPEYASHETVNHSEKEYVRGTAHVNTAESFHALLKRGIYGSFHAVSEHHLNRYVSEAAFKFNNRIALGVDDAERAATAIRGAEGKRLTYRQSDRA